MKRGKDQIPMRGGEEYDMLTRARKLYGHGRGRSKQAKRSFNRRLTRSVILPCQ